MSYVFVQQLDVSPQRCGLLVFLSTHVSTSFRAEDGDAGSVDGEKRTERERERQIAGGKGEGVGQQGGVEWGWVQGGVGL